MIISQSFLPLFFLNQKSRKKNILQNLYEIWFLHMSIGATNVLHLNDGNVQVVEKKDQLDSVWKNVGGRFKNNIFFVPKEVLQMSYCLPECEY